MGANLYGLYFERDGVVLRIPVNPESYAIAKENNNAEYNVLGLGPVMVPRKPKLQTISWDGYFPGNPDGEAVLTAGQFAPPKTYIDFFQSAMNDRIPVNFVANRYQEDGTAIIEGLKEILADIEAGKVELTAENEDIHMNVEALLTARIGSAGKRLHTARSRNDQVAVDLRLYLKKEN